MRIQQSPFRLQLFRDCRRNRECIQNDSPGLSLLMIEAIINFRIYLTFAIYNYYYYNFFVGLPVT